MSNRGKITIGLLTTAVSAVIAFLIGWTGWNSLQVVAQGKETTANTTTLTGLLAAIGELKDGQDKLSNDVNQLKIDSATTRQLLHDLSRDRFQYDPRQAEAKALQTITTE